MNNYLASSAQLGNYLNDQAACFANIIVYTGLAATYQNVLGELRRRDRLKVARGEGTAIPANHGNYCSQERFAAMIIQTINGGPF